jgi:hypothetical protein
MDKNARCIEVRTADGTLILSLYLVEKQIGRDNKQATNASKNQKSGQQNNPENARSPDDDGMTDAQKRYLFRILAEQGIEGDDAHEHLKDLFQVGSLKEVTKIEASRMIEQLLEKAER